MRNEVTRVVALLMTLALTAALVAGCKDGSGGDADAALSEFVYVPEAVRLPDGIGMVFANGVAVSDDRIFIAASASRLNEHTSEHNTYFELYSRIFDRSSFVKLMRYVPPRASVPEASGWSRIDAICADNDGNLWITEQWQFGGYDLPDGFDPERDNLDDYEYIDYGSGTALRKLDNEGRELLSMDLSGISGNREDFLIRALNIDGAGNIYLAVTGGGSAIFVLGNDGRELFHLDTSGRQVDRLIQMPDGTIAFLDSMVIDIEANFRMLQTIDADAKSFGSSVNIPGVGIGTKIYPASGEFDLLASDPDSLYGLVLGDEEPVKLLDWADIELYIELSGDGAEESVAVLPDGRMMRISNAFDPWAGGFKVELVLLTAIPRSELPDMPKKTVLSLATLNARAIRDLVVEFNRTNPDYRIEVTDYSEGVERDAGLIRLNAEIISGNIPDILDVNHMPYMQYAAKGLLADLYPLIDSDPGIDRSDFMEGALRAAEIDGALYVAFPFFTVRAIIGNPSVIGTGLKMTLDELKAAIDAHPDADFPLGAGITRNSFLQTTILFDINEYIDWEKGTVDFDSGNFVALLEFAGMFPAETDRSLSWVDLVPSGRQIMAFEQLDHILSLQLYKSMFGGELAIKGFPVKNSSGVSLTASNMFAIAADSNNKDGAWEFIRSFFGQERQPPTFEQCFPVSRAAFDELIAKNIHDSEHIEIRFGVNLSDGSGYDIIIEPITQEEVDLLESMIDSAAVMTGAYGHLGVDVWNIISEGASDFFNGACSAEEAAKVIQSRASILVSEQS